MPKLQTKVNKHKLKCFLFTLLWIWTISINKIMEKEFVLLPGQIKMQKDIYIFLCLCSFEKLIWQKRTEPISVVTDCLHTAPGRREQRLLHFLWLNFTTPSDYHNISFLHCKQQSPKSPQTPTLTSSSPSFIIKPFFVFLITHLFLNFVRGMAALIDRWADTGQYLPGATSADITSVLLLLTFKPRWIILQDIHISVSQMTTSIQRSSW